MNYKQMLDKLAELEQRIANLEHQQRVAAWPNTDKQWPRGCRVCGLGSDGKSYGYVCNRTDCPTAVTCNIQDAFK
jgi:hypothetical protein